MITGYAAGFSAGSYLVAWHASGDNWSNAEGAANLWAEHVGPAPLWTRGQMQACLSGAGPRCAGHRRRHRMASASSHPGPPANARPPTLPWRLSTHTARRPTPDDAGRARPRGVTSTRRSHVGLRQAMSAAPASNAQGARARVTSIPGRCPAPPLAQEPPVG